MKLAQKLKSLLEAFYDAGTSYYVIMAFEGDQQKNDLANFHTTLIYMGSLDVQQQAQVADILDNYFSTNQPDKREVTFDRESFFGKDKDVRVLEAKIEDIPKFFPDLREKLMPYNASQFTDYKPHMTSDLPAPQTLVINRVMFSKSEYQTIKQYDLK